MEIQTLIFMQFVVNGVFWPYLHKIFRNLIDIYDAYNTLSNYTVS